MSEKIYKYYDKYDAEVEVVDGDEHSVLMISVKIPKMNWTHNIHTLQTTIDRDVIFGSLVRQVLGYYLREITIEPEGVKK